ncbi:MAG: 6-bladed beta-propeller [Planctomycetota bacterium]
MTLRPLAGLTLLLAACASTGGGGPAELVMFPPPPDPPRILFLRSVSSGEDIEPHESSWLAQVVVGEETSDQKPMPKPCAIAVRSGIFYVTDTQSGGIYALDFAKKTAGQVDLRGRARLLTPTGICFGPDGSVYIADRARKQVVVLDDKFQWVKELGPWDEKSGPTDVAVWKDRLYVTDAGSNCVRVLSLATGDQLMVLGNADNENEYMRGPSNLVVDENGYLFAVDTVYSRIYVWDADGKFVRHIGRPGDAPGYLARPKGVTLADRKLFVLDSAFDNCQILDLDGHPLMFFGGQGETPGSMSFPRKVWVGADGLEAFRTELAAAPDFEAERLIVVSNTWGPKLSFYALGKSKRFQYPEQSLPERPTTPPPEPTPAEKAAEATAEPKK